MVYKFFDKKTESEISVNEKPAESHINEWLKVHESKSYRKYLNKLVDQFNYTHHHSINKKQN